MSLFPLLILLSGLIGFDYIGADDSVKLPPSGMLFVYALVCTLFVTRRSRHQARQPIDGLSRQESVLGVRTSIEKPYWESGLLAATGSFYPTQNTLLGPGAKSL